MLLECAYTHIVLALNGVCMYMQLKVIYFYLYNWSFVFSLFHKKWSYMMSAVVCTATN